MSFITRCPACHTAFKVVSDQLKISEGWVRCGHCQQIFDATLDLQPWWPGVETVPVQAPVAPPAPPAPAPAPAPAPVEPVPDVVEPGPLAAAPPFTQPDDPSKASAPAVPSFVRQAQRRAFWRRPWVRWGLGLAVLLLLLALGAQTVWHWRDPIVVQVPQTQPVLETLCAPLECEVPAPRQLDDIVIESSVLMLSGPGRYTFNVVVRNQAAVELSAPALELTLTDLQDQVLVRRVLLPHEWPEPRTTLAPGVVWPVQFEFELEQPLAQVMTGYRAILFYP